MQKFEPDQLVLVKFVSGGPWRLRRYSFLDGDEHEMQDGSVWDDEHILPYSGNEHLLGTTESPTPEWEPKPGTLVAVSDNRKDWYPAIFYNADEDEDGIRYLVNVTPSSCVGFKYCEPLRKHFSMPEDGND